jgi:hypothetical protein
MKRFRIIGLSLLALFALGAFAATTASAEEGVLPLKVKTFNVLIKSKTAVLETSSEALPPIICTALTGSGSFETDSHGKATLDFDSCTAGGFPANSLGDTAGLILAPGLFLICLTGSLEFGLFFELTSPVHIEVPSIAGLLFLVEGTVIGKIDAKAGELLKLIVVLFHGKKGVQETKVCTDEKGGKKEASLKEGENKLAASEEVEALIQFGENEELMDK